MKSVVFAPVLLLQFASCHNSPRRIELGDSYAEGNISQDSVYNGTIRFYNKASGKLETEANYVNNVLEGPYKEFYPDGKTRSEGQRRSGYTFGATTIFDDKGNLSAKQFSYFGLRCGEAVDYRLGKPADYHFYGLDGTELMHISYDSLPHQRIEQLNESHFFFWQTRDYSETSSPATRRSELFVYLPKPDGLSFDYSLCVVNEQGAIVRATDELESDLPWKELALDWTRLRTGEAYCLKLEAENSLRSDGKAIMLKRL